MIDKIIPVRRFRFVLRRGVPQLHQVIVIPGCVRIKPVVQAVCRPQAAELVPARFLIETALPHKLLQILHFRFPADCSLHGFGDPRSGMIAVPPQYIQLKPDVCSILRFLLLFVISFLHTASPCPVCRLTRISKSISISLFRTMMQCLIPHLIDKQNGWYNLSGRSERRVMAQTYSIEFREEACKRVQSGVPAAQAARGPGINANTLCTWMSRFKERPAEPFAGSGNLHQEDTGLRALKKRMKDPEAEKIFLSA